MVGLHVVLESGLPFGDFPAGVAAPHTALLRAGRLLDILPDQHVHV